METRRGMRRLLAGVLLVMLLASSGDLIMDRPRSWLSLHVAFELIMIAAAGVGVVAFWLAWWGARRSVAELQHSLERQREERDAWRQSAESALQGLGRALDAQFDAWQLTPAERQVALQVLKGRSHKQIARLTGRSERTVRQHATVVYQKAGLAGRAELAAFFLEDLMLPASERESAGV